MVKNGVVFKPLDIKALISQTYTRSLIPTVFTGERCNLEKPNIDSFGGYIEPECRDLSPDFFHLAVVNVLGKLKQTFVMDMDATAEVWNHVTSILTISPLLAIQSWP